MWLGKAFQAEDTAGQRPRDVVEHGLGSRQRWSESVWGLGCRPRIWTLSCGLWRASKVLGEE